MGVDLRTFPTFFFGTSVNGPSRPPLTIPSHPPSSNLSPIYPPLSCDMSRLADPPTSRITFAGLPDGRTRNIPVLSSSGQSAMDITPPPAGAHGSSDDRMGITNGADTGNNTLNVPNPAIGAAAAAQQPKVVQTAFIHKLYKYVWSGALPFCLLTRWNSMLEDPSIQHLISWSGTNDSFVMSPTSEFSKVLAWVLSPLPMSSPLTLADRISSTPIFHHSFAS